MQLKHSPDPGPFHEGALAVQERAGERDIGASRAPMIARTLSAPAQSFLVQQRAVAVGIADSDGHPWASMWLGLPGFATATSDSVVRVAFLDPVMNPHDPVQPLLSEGNAIGLLAIDLGTRRRLRINGVITTSNASGLSVVTHEVFPNCPKYIQKRDWLAALNPSPVAGFETGCALDFVQQSQISDIDTFFVASRHPVRGVDVSHRGGEPGFVQVLDAHTLRIPDYPGNSMFQTLGNFEVDPRAGVLMVDFARDRFLSITGHVRLSFATDIPDHPSGGTGRYWQLDIQRWVAFPMRPDFHSQLVERSTFNPPPSQGS